MNVISPLLTDLYQLTMAYGYWKLGLDKREAVFHQIFRKYPFKSNYVVSCGLATVIEFLQNWRFAADDIEYLRDLRMANGQALFTEDFLEYLITLRFTCDIDAVAEGTLAFANEPLLRIKGPLIQGQLLESTLLNILNFQTLIATKASRVCEAAQGESVLEFGMRRAQGPDGALSASRAAYVGGCDATSNVLAGKLYGIPVRGTHAHSWVTVFDDEISAFEAYADVMPHNCVLLVDTYDTIRGVANAIAIGKKLRAKGSELQGIRLDSGDLASLSVRAREMLDAEGFTETKIIASNSLDEYVIADMKRKGAQVSIWGVGTNLATAYDHPALDGVYKLSALQDVDGNWQYKIKLSEQAVKISNPGIYQVRRFFKNNLPVMDMMYDVENGVAAHPEVFALESPHPKMILPKYDTAHDLLIPIFRKGQCVYQDDNIHKARERAIQQVTQYRKAYGEQLYPVGLEKNLHDIKQKLINKVSQNVTK